MFRKIGEISQISLQSLSSSVPEVDQQTLENFRKLAGDLKKVAPKAEDFLYFSCTMMHAAEASALHDDGTPKFNAHGEEVKVGWDKSGGTYRWISNDPNVKPYKNSNGDIFPEEELVRAYKKWVNKPLCIDHKSSSVDHVRGFIVDTYYDRNLKRVIALCALDKKGYPQLARQVSTGVSNCVSMGTAVGRAICTDCAKVARVEADFCDHMRRKSGYGEINADLSPIELSIVVNGADPKANIKNIIAATQTLNNYLDSKTQEVKQALAEVSYSASIRVNDANEDGSNAKSIDITSKSLEDFKSDIASALEDYKMLDSAIKEEIFDDQSANTTNEIVSNQLPSENMQEKSAQLELETSEVDDKSIDELKNVQASIEAKLELLTASLNKLESNLTKKQEETMSGKEIKKDAYYLGTEDPTPGQAQYKEDPKDAKVRADADDYLHGRYSRTDMGGDAGLYPGDLEAKKLLARAQADERAQLRAEAVAKAKEALKNKEAYYLNGEGDSNPNTPTPGKVKYAPSKEDTKTRQVALDFERGPEAISPSMKPYFSEDEKKKKLLQRASLRARFVKAANEDGTQDLANSAWEVFLGDKLVLTASVADFAGDRVDAMYDMIATEDAGKKLIEKVKLAGVDGVKAMFKKAQAAEAQVPAAALPDATPVSVPVEGPGDAVDTGKSGDPKEQAMDLAVKAQDAISDLVEVIRVLTGEQAEMGQMDPGALGATASDKSLALVRKDLNQKLVVAMEEAVSELKAAKEELDIVTDTYTAGVSPASAEQVAAIANDTIDEAKTALANSFDVLTAFVRYAGASKALEKRAEVESELEKLAEDGEDDMNDAHDGDDLMSLINATDEELDLLKEDLDDEDDDVLATDPLSDDEFLLSVEDEHEANVQAKKDELKDLGSLPPGSTVTVTASDDFDSKAGRTALRAKLAAETLKIDPILYEAHPAGGTDTVPGDKTNLSHVEDLVEAHEVMTDVALSPVRVRKDAEALHQLISEGKVQVSDLDELVSVGGLDKAALEYYKVYYGKGSDSYVKEMLKEHSKASEDAEKAEYRVKVARAYELAHDMAARGLCANTREGVSNQVNEIMGFSDENFEALKRVVAKNPLQKQASRMPQVGLLSNDNASESEAPSMYDELTRMFGSTSKRGNF